MGWAARFVIVDVGDGNEPKGGSFWVHYAISTPAIHSGRVLVARDVMVNYEVPNHIPISELNIGAVHVWDGNRRIFTDDSASPSGDDYNGGFPGVVVDPGGTIGPDKSKLLIRSFDKKMIFFGIGVSLRIDANTAKDAFLEIRGVGITFDAEDRT